MAHEYHLTDKRGHPCQLGHPWQHVEDDAAALRLFIEETTRELETQPAWIVVETGQGQQFTAFSDETYAENFAGDRAAERNGGEFFSGVPFSGLPQDAVRVQVSRVSWPAGSKWATVVSYLHDGLGEDFLLALPPVAAVAYDSRALEFREWSIGGPDTVTRGLAGVLAVNGDTEEGGW